mmetsp:Transcript_18123/g.30273  ORF Transcript_18123/g.30273 Transcript_18123/m.30273 type:complete len:205 (-) Transcript_18123:274-888(-)|eukprot:CAMPEP_0119346736 /NCGR_PEP_ID=MMETSP1333-20130426/108159_1 /TAXON_ID=418940 /ORGANISM="Scyphosphaera apsteinii, Strain RCC1455" /LENGTH=204 /DNA_ID=CAMNT_0007359251 /DNA_START=798 /DNA_END=1412 /DNA_ORIENTATION=-
MRLRLYDEDRHLRPFQITADSHERARFTLPLEQGQKPDGAAARDATQPRAFTGIADDLLAIKNVGVGTADGHKIDQLLRAVPVDHDERRRKVSIPPNHSHATCHQHRIQKHCDPWAMGPNERPCSCLHCLLHSLEAVTICLDQCLCSLAHGRKFGLFAHHDARKPPHTRSPNDLRQCCNKCSPSLLTARRDCCTAGAALQRKFA